MTDQSHGFFTKLIAAARYLPRQLKMAGIIVLVMMWAAFRINAWVEQKQTLHAVESILRNEYRTANSYALSKAISDLELLGIVRCTVLTEKAEVNRVYYDTSGDDKCWTSVFYKRFFGSAVEFQAINGQTYQFEFQQVTSLSRLAGELLSYGFTLIVLALYAQHLQKQTENSAIKLNLANLEREQALDRAKQAGHDVASPVGALRVAVSFLKDINPDVRNLIVRSIDRTEEILVQLKKIPLERTKGPLVNQVNLMDALQTIADERKLAWQDQSQIYIKSQSDLFILADAGELKRILSNLLNNSHEACNKGKKLTIEVSTFQSDHAITVEIKDNGRGMDSSTLAQIGKKGFTVGKEKYKTAGSGLGVYHAKTTLESWGGSLHFESHCGQGTIATLRFAPKGPATA